jgi:4-amino-4-deoxy-L-arabinose transferase-like glycosyltransferase
MKERESQVFNNKLFFLFALTALWFLIALVVNPLGEFPLNDDWAYSRNVYDLAVNGILRFSNWPAMTLIAQTLWGALFCKLFGFSFGVLRLSVLILGWAGLMAFFLLSVKLLQNTKLAFFFTLILAFNPLYFSLSYTYMTEIPFLACFISALYFYFLYYDDQKIKNLVIASLFALIASMIRQHGLLIAFALVLTTLLSGRIRIKRLILETALACLIVGIFVGFKYYLKAKHLLPVSFGSVSELIRTLKFRIFIHDLFFRSSILLIYSGFFLLPLAIIAMPSCLKNCRLSAKLLIAFVSALVCLPVVQNIRSVPFGNIFYNLGLGPKLLKDAYWGLNQHPVLPVSMLIVIYVLGILGSFLLIYCLILTMVKWKKSLRGTSAGKIKLQILMIGGGYLGFLLILNSFYDRYFLPVILILMVLILSPEMKIHKSSLISLILMLSISFFSVTATHDYLSFNRARWQGLNSLMAKGISPHQIDGGFEFNCWYQTGDIHWGKMIPQEKSWWCVDDDTYMLAVGNVGGYQIVRSIKYKSLLTFTQDSVLILKRTTIIPVK